MSFCHLPVVSETKSFGPECKDCYPSGVRELKCLKKKNDLGLSEFAMPHLLYFHDVIMSMSCRHKSLTDIRHLERETFSQRSESISTR